MQEESDNVDHVIKEALMRALCISHEALATCTILYYGFITVGPLPLSIAVNN